MADPTMAVVGSPYKLDSIKTENKRTEKWIVNENRPLIQSAPCEDCSFNLESIDAKKEFDHNSYIISIDKNKQTISWYEGQWQFIDASTCTYMGFSEVPPMGPKVMSIPDPNNSSKEERKAFIDRTKWLDSNIQRIQSNFAFALSVNSYMASDKVAGKYIKFVQDWKWPDIKIYKFEKQTTDFLDDPEIADFNKAEMLKQWKESADPHPELNTIKHYIDCLTKDMVVSVGEVRSIPKENSFTYPNPANDFVQLPDDITINPNTKVKVIDMIGNQFIPEIIGNNQIDVSKLTNGTYIYQIVNGSEIKSGKFVVIH